MRTVRGWFLGSVFTVILITLRIADQFSWRQNSGRTVEAANLLPPSAPPDPAVQRVIDLGSKYREITPSDLRTKFTIIREEKNGSADVFYVAPFGDEAEARFEFEGSAILSAYVRRKDTTGYYILFNSQGDIIQYWEEKGRRRLPHGISVDFHTNGMLETVAHFQDGNWIGEVGKYNEAGNLIFYTNYSRPQPITIRK